MRHGQTIRPGAIERGLEICALCDDFVCDKVGHLPASREGLLIYLQVKMADVAEEEYRLCARQFESMPNLIQILAAAGQMPSWVMGDEE